MKILYDFECIWAGFYSQYFFFLQAYICSKSINQPLYYDDSKWKFKYNKGLEDYFTIHDNMLHSHVFTEKDMTDMSVMVRRHEPHNPREYFPLYKYREAIKDIYTLNDTLKEKAKYVRQQLPEKFNAIFVRWGDKKIEIKHDGRDIEIELYVKKLLETCGDNRNLMVHSDDHDLVMEVAQYLRSNPYENFNFFCLTNEEERGGTLVCEMYRANYPIKTKKSLEQMTPSEVRDHTEKMLVAIEIMSEADNVILDYQSNVSRFLKLYYNESRCKVWDVFGNSLDENVACIPPAYGFQIQDFINVPPKKPSLPEPPKPEPLEPQKCITSEQLQGKSQIDILLGLVVPPKTGGENNITEK